MNLVEPNEGISISDIGCPDELYWVLTEPAPLAGMKFPRFDFPWNKVHSLGFRHLVALSPGSYDPSPLSILFNENLEDLIHGGLPHNPIYEKQLIRKAVTATIETIRSGEGVLIHCIGGRGRTGSVIGCVLRELGFETGLIISYLNRVHKARGKTGWPESSWQSKLVACWELTDSN